MWSMPNDRLRLGGACIGQQDREYSVTCGGAAITSHHIEFEYPDELLHACNETELLRLAQEAFYVRLYQQGAISSARAATQLGLGRVAFLDLLGAYGVSYFDEEAEFAEDVRNADQARS